MSMKRNDDAVSPVIGVILMVAITVILAAVIAAFVFGLVGNVQGAKVVGLTVAADGDTAVITWQGGADLANLQGGSIRVGTEAPAVFGKQSVGNITYFPRAIQGERVVINATFADGSGQVIFDKQF